MKVKILVLLLLVFLYSCKSKKEIYYMQDIDAYNNTAVNYTNPTLQPNDILNISVGALVPEAVIPYNKLSPNASSSSEGSSQLEGYLVSPELTISFPILGEISVANKTIPELQKELKDRLESGGHLVNPSVSIRLLNAKVTILGEVRSPGTYTFNESNINLLQVLGLAGDLTINGERNDVVLMRETNGVRTISHFDLTKSDWLQSPYYLIKTNDVIIVNPNGPEVQRAGYFGSISGIIGIALTAFSTVLLILSL